MRQISNIMTKTRLLITTFALLLLTVSCTRTEKTYYPDGAVQSIIHYKGSKEHGKSVYFFNRPNTVEIEVEMRDGKRNGEFRRYFVNGLLDTHCTYKDDNIEGVETMYLANGTKSQETTYRNGKKNGPHTAYHIDGSVKIEGGFSNDKFDGPWNYYDERGVLVGEGIFKDGTGTVTSYYPTGQIETTTHYVDNKKDGKEIHYTKSGQPFQEIVFKSDRIVSEKTDSTLLK